MQLSWIANKAAKATYIDQRKSFNSCQLKAGQKHIHQNLFQFNVEKYNPKNSSNQQWKGNPCPQKIIQSYYLRCDQLPKKVIKHCCKDPPTRKMIFYVIFHIKSPCPQKWTLNTKSYRTFLTRAASFIQSSSNFGNGF